MKNEFEDYLNLIGLTSIKMKERVDELLSYASIICKEEFEDIFITEYITKEGERVYSHLRLFSKPYRITFKEFINSYDLTICKQPNNQKFIRFRPSNYNLKKANKDSKIEVNTFADEHMYGNFLATKENCDVLMKIIKKYYTPHLIGKF